MIPSQPRTNRTPGAAADVAAAAAPASRGGLAALALAMLLSSLGTSIANVALPTLAQAFGVPFQTVQWVVLAYLIAVTSTIVSAGRLGDRIGRRRLLTIGLLAFSAAALVSGAAPSLGVLIAARALQGLGAAVLMALALAFVSEIVPTTETGRAMGLLGTTSAVGTALGPSLGGVLIHSLGWRAIFLVNVPLGLLAIALVARYLPGDRRDASGRRPAPTLPATMLLVATVASYALAATVGRGHLGATNGVLLAAAVLGAALFARSESRAATPLIQWPMLREPAMRAGLTASLLVATVLMATLVVGPFYLSIALGLDPRLVGLVMSAGPLAAALTGVPAGRLVDRYGTRRTTAVGLTGIAAGSVALALTPTRLGIPGYVAPIVLLTASYALFQAANNTSVMSNVRAAHRGLVSGMLNLARNLGLVTGTAVMGAVFAAASATHAGGAPEAAAFGLRVTFAVASALVAVVLLASATTAAPARSCAVVPIASA